MNNDIKKYCKKKRLFQKVSSKGSGAENLIMGGETTERYRSLLYGTTRFTKLFTKKIDLG